MAHTVGHSVYPRRLREKEWDALSFVLPADRPGYRHYRDTMGSLVALGEGRRGPGNLVLGSEGDTADTTAPLAPVVAYGIIETIFEPISVTVREYTGRQIDVEIVSGNGGEIPDHYEEKRRWTYSTWKPGSLSPATGTPVREVPIQENVRLAIGVAEKRMWLYDGGTGMIHLIPVTNFYNELMLHKKIRDPKLALNSNLLYERCGTYSDVDLRAAFVAYNSLKRRIHVVHSPSIVGKKRMADVVVEWFRKK